MLVRTLVSVLYIVIVIGALALKFFFPFLATILLYGLLAWFVASFFVYRLPIMSRPVFRRGGAPGNGVGPIVAGAPPLGAGTPLSVGDLGFCMYCGTSLDAGAVNCPSCGRSIPV